MDSDWMEIWFRDQTQGTILFIPALVESGPITVPSRVEYLASHVAHIQGPDLKQSRDEPTEGFLALRFWAQTPRSGKSGPCQTGPDLGSILAPELYSLRSGPI